MTEAERAQALDAIAAEIARCTRCRLHEGRTRVVPGEGNPDTEVVFVGEGPGFNEDRQGRPFVGRAGRVLVDLLALIGWRREDVFITNVVKCRPPENRDPEPDEIAACAPFLARQLEVLDPALVVTLGRHSMGRFMPGARISQVHGTWLKADPALGAPDALVYAMYHPAAADRSPEVMRQSRLDAESIPTALLEARRLRAASSEADGPAAASADASAERENGAAAQDSVTEHSAPERPAARQPAADLAAPPDPAPRATDASPADIAVTPPSPELEPARPADQLTLF